jgi:hypothetical protein
VRTTLQRRTFLVGLGGFAAFAGLPSPARALPPDGAWKALKDRLKGALLQPGDPGYLDTALPQNLRYRAILPRGIALCQTPEQVAICLRWAAQHDVHPAIRGGGHSYAGYSTTNSLMISTRGLNEIRPDGAGHVRIGGGVLNGAIYDALKPINATITHGRCKTVGAAGFLLGGGIGFNMRRLGVGSDLLTATDLVLADGTIMTASPSDNREVFWACNGGGGGNFGVNTSFTLALADAPTLCVFNLTWSAKTDQILPVMLETLRKAPDTLGSKVSVNAPSPSQRRARQDCQLTLLGQLVGTDAALRDLLRPVTTIAAWDASPPPGVRPAQYGIYTKPYWDGQDFLSESGGSGYYQERSRFFGGTLSARAITEAFRFARALPGETAKTCEFKFFQTGGKVNARTPRATAFVHRNSDWLFDVEVNWNAADPPKDREANLRWQTEFYLAMAPYMTGQSFQNFPDPSLGTAWQTAYYGGNYDALREVKTLTDRHARFRFAQGIPPL